MPTPKSIDDIPMTGDGNEKVSTLQYLEARIRDAREHTGLEISALREMQLRFRDDALHARKIDMEIVEQRIEERDLRAQQRFDAQTIALNAAMLAAEKAINAAMVASEKAIQAALSSAKEAVTKAELASDIRFQSVNEFRAQLSDQTATFIPRTEAAARFDGLAEKVGTLSSRIDKSEGSGQGLSKGWGILLGAVGLLGTLAGIVMLLLSRVPN